MKSAWIEHIPVIWFEPKSGQAQRKLAEIYPAAAQKIEVELIADLDHIAMARNRAVRGGPSCEAGWQRNEPVLFTRAG